MSSSKTTVLDIDFVRSHFPALDDWALFDNAGGSVILQPVIDRICQYMSRYQIQLGASYPRSVEAGKLVEDGHRAMAELIGAEADEVVIGSSSTVNVLLHAQALRPLSLLDQSTGSELVEDARHERLVRHSGLYRFDL